MEFTHEYFFSTTKSLFDKKRSGARINRINLLTNVSMLISVLGPHGHRREPHLVLKLCQALTGLLACQLFAAGQFEVELSPLDLTDCQVLPVDLLDI